MRLQCRLLLTLSLITSFSWAADDPFIGKWKVNPAESKLTDEMMVELAGENRYAITFGPGAVDTITADGSDQPGLRGTTLSVAVEGPKTWRVVRKREVRMFISATWTLSEDGKTLTDDFTGYGSDGSKHTVGYVYERTAGSSGFTGTWDSVGAKVDSSIQLDIKPWEGDGLSLAIPGAQISKSLRSDGRDYPDGVRASDGAACSGRRLNERTLEITNKRDGRITDTWQIGLSGDGRILTLTMRPERQSTPQNILVFDRE